jgi:hypothetical protein
VGSFYAFAIWIGLAVAFVRMARKADKVGQNALIYGSYLIFFIVLMSSLRGSPGTALMTDLYMALYAVVMIGVTYIVRALSGGKQLGYVEYHTSVTALLCQYYVAAGMWDDRRRKPYS